MGTGTVYLMYHELRLPNRKLCRSDQGYARYVITEADFREQIAWLQKNGFRGLTVGEALEGADRSQRPIVITFDDGAETDLITAAPLLKEAGFNSTFYIIAGFIGRRGYLSASQVQALSELGFEIGCHSMTHAYLSDLDADGLRVEMAEAKQRLEQLIGKQVLHFSCPGGRWNSRVARAAEEAGYASVATSRLGKNPEAADRFCLARVVVMRGTAIAEFDRLCRAEGLMARRAYGAALSVSKAVLGNFIYDKLRSAVLNKVK